MPRMSPFERFVCQSWPWRIFTTRLVLPWALQGVRLAGRGLEIGAGSSAMAAELVARYPHLDLTVTDLDASMLAPAARRTHGSEDRRHIAAADAAALPFGDASFDVVLSFIMLHHVVAWDRALEEALRVLRPGGLMVGYDLLDGLLARACHSAEGAGFRLMRLEDLERTLDALPADHVETRVGMGRMLIRLKIRKTR